MFVNGEAARVPPAPGHLKKKLLQLAKAFDVPAEPLYRICGEVQDFHP
jgi:hypothetical protein